MPLGLGVGHLGLGVGHLGLGCGAVRGVAFRLG